MGNTEFRVVMNIAKTAQGGWTVTEYTPDEGSNGVVASSVTFDGKTLKLAFDGIRATYEGILTASESSWRRDQTSHDGNVKLEVVDWDGSGRVLILLAGGNNTAHSFDRFAPKLTTAYRVYGITRRGSGVSSAPPPTREKYAADRLGDDVLAVIAALKLNRPI